MPADPIASAYGQPHAADAHRLRWPAHVDAGRIGRRVTPDPAIRAILARRETMLGLTRRGASRVGV